MPQFYEAWKILKHKRIRMRNVVSTGPAGENVVTDETARDCHVVRFKRKYNKTFHFAQDTNFISNWGAGDRTYLYMFSYNNDQRWGGAGNRGDSC